MQFLQRKKGEKRKGSIQKCQLAPPGEKRDRSRDRDRDGNKDEKADENGPIVLRLRGFRSSVFQISQTFGANYRR